MRKTGFQAQFALFDITAREDAAFRTGSNQPFGRIALAKDNITYRDYGTLEQDYFLLDGSFPEMPDDWTAVYFSDTLSDGNGGFAVPPEFELTFTENHSSYGLTFYFVGDYPLEMTVTWYDIFNIQIAERAYTITANTFFAQNQVVNYGKLKVKFTKAKPHRYVKFRYLEYGTNLLIGRDGIPVEKASLIEEADVISDKIPVNKLTFSIIDDGDTFNVGNIQGLHNVIQSGQMCMAYEYVDNERILLGKFFLQSHRTEKNVTQMEFCDSKGLLDSRRFVRGRVYAGEPAGIVIDEIMEDAGIEDYRVDEDVARMPLYGWLKIDSCRNALREVVFACGAVVDSGRMERMEIYVLDRTIRSSVQRSRKFETQISNQEYVSDVSVKFATYTLEDEESEIVRGEYPAGEHTVELSEPATDMRINSGILLFQSANYVTFKINVDSEVVITGFKYQKKELAALATESTVSSGNVRNTVEYSGALLSATQAAVVAKKILEYHRLRLNIKTKFLNEGDKATDWAEIQNNVRAYGDFVAGFEKMTTDLTGGFITTAEARGYFKLLTDYDYMAEIFAEDEVGVL